MSKKIWIAAVIVVVLLVIGKIFMPAWHEDSYSVSVPGTSNTSNLESQATSNEELDLLIKQQIDEATRRYLQKNEELLNNFLAKLPHIAADSFKVADGNVENVVQHSTQYKFCLTLVWCMTKDKLAGSNTTEQMLQPLINENFVLLLSAAQTAISDELANFMLEIQKNDNQYRAGLEKITASSNFRASKFASDRAFCQRMEQLKRDITDYSLSMVIESVGLAVEVVFLKATIKTVTSACAAIVAKFAGSATAAGTAAAVDGPFPIGDAVGAVIAIGGSVWTSYEIYKLTVKLPQELRTSLHNMIADYRVSLQKEAEAQARKLVEKCNSSVIKFD